MTAISLVILGVSFLLFISANRDLKYANLMNKATVDKLHVALRKAEEERLIKIEEWKTILEERTLMLEEMDHIKLWVVGEVYHAYLEDENYKSASKAKKVMDDIVKRMLKK